MHGPSHGGSSSFSGGSSSGSSGASFSAGTSGGFRFGGGPRTIFFFGGRYSIARGILNWITFGFLGLIFLIIMTVMVSKEFVGYKNNISYMKEDAIEYEYIIANADEDGVYIDGKTYYRYSIDGINFKPDSGVFVDGYTYNGFSWREGQTEIVANLCFEYEDLDYFQIYYTFIDDDGNEITGLTYAQYSENEIKNFHTLSVSYSVSGNEIWSINSDYTLENNIEYFHTKAQLKGVRTMIIIYSSIGAVILISIVLSIVFGLKRVKKENEIKDQQQLADIEKTKAETDLYKAETKSKNHKCAYCGSTIPDGSSTCPGCGSHIQK